MPLPLPLPLFRKAGSGLKQSVLGVRHVYKVTPAETEGCFLLLEATVDPGQGAPLHRHAVDSECFYLLEGELTFEGPEGRIDAKAGDCCFLPVGSAHAFRNEGATPARVLVFTTPGRAAMDFFTEMSRAANDGGPDVQRAAEIAGSHGITILQKAVAAA